MQKQSGILHCTLTKLQERFCILISQYCNYRRENLLNWGKSKYIAKIVGQYILLLSRQKSSTHLDNDGSASTSPDLFDEAAAEQFQCAEYVASIEALKLLCAVCQNVALVIMTSCITLRAWPCTIVTASWTSDSHQSM